MLGDFKITDKGVLRSTTGAFYTPEEVKTVLDDVAMICDKYQYAVERIQLEREASHNRYWNAKIDTAAGFLTTVLCSFGFIRVWPHLRAQDSVLYKFRVFPALPPWLARGTNGYGVLLGAAWLISFESLGYGLICMRRHTSLVPELNDQEKVKTEEWDALKQVRKSLEPWSKKD